MFFERNALITLFTVPNEISSDSDILRWKEIEINKSSQEVQIYVEGVPAGVDLTALEFKLLSFFAKNAQNVISRENWRLKSQKVG